jgi:acetyl-CoA carboxylase biotin carboxylase subunit
MFGKVLIANRGEIAVRILRACQEMEMAAVAVYSEADASALHTRLADEAVCIGPAAAAESYLHIDHIIEAALAAGCDAIHPGYGFLAESPAFARAVRKAGLAFIGPPADAIEKMGVKTQARRLMREAGVPIVPGFSGAEATATDFGRAADEIGYPVLIKAASGGGGIGMRAVHDPRDLADALAATRRAAQSAFGDPTLYLEKYIVGARHIEVQILADQDGQIVHLFERECSIQRRHQKIMEESPSPFVTPALRAQLGQAAVAAARAVSYTNAGTVEFIVDGQGNFYFLEMNTRLQVEHPITELATGVDLVQAQLAIAAGKPLAFAQGDLVQRGHALECRIYAEDPARDFLPATGRVYQFVAPTGPGVRVDSGVAAGDEVSVYYDPLLAKLSVTAETRIAALRKMAWALSQFTILGVTTNLAFLADIIRHPLFVEGKATTQFIEQQMAAWRPSQDGVEIALMAAALAETTNRSQPGTRTTGAPHRMDPWQSADGFRLGIS